ncbi:MAG: tRNA pseudouridine13 synthase [Verrucomicrobiales bacterium]|jgi:tRNA pseudouridine13 synthase
MDAALQTPTPFLHGGPLGRAQFKSEPEDFVVEEVLGFEPSGVGEHCLVWAEKRDLDSNTAAARLADALGIRRRLVSHCGLKDRQAVTRQWFSIHIPGQESPEAPALESEGLRVLQVTRNTRKLRRGIHAGNRFTIRLRQPDFAPADAMTRWQAIKEQGTPNVFGPQRFGRDGRNVDKALAMFRGEFEPRDRLLRGIFLSAARSHLFNVAVTKRMTRGIWDQPVEGEVYGFADNRTLILPEKQRGDEIERFHAGVVELTAPLWGAGELHSVGALRDFEQEIAAQHSEIIAGLEAYGLRQERRVIRLRPENSSCEVVDEGDLIFQFDLPKGAYATALLRELADFSE